MIKLITHLEILEDAGFKAKTIEDEEIIKEYILKGIEIYCDDDYKVTTGDNEHIADLINCNDSKISLDNGNSYISIDELSDYKDEIIEKWEVIEMYMDSETMNVVAYEIAPCSELEFLKLYLQKATTDITIG